MILLAITVKGLTIVFLTLLIIVMVLIGLVLLYGFKNFKLITSEVGWRNLIREKITCAILEGVESIRNDASLLSHLGNRDFDKIFLQTLVESDKKLSGDAHGILVEVFYAFKMDALAFKKFRSNNRFKKLRGIDALTAMNVKEAVPEISLLLEYPDPLVVAEAQYAMVRFEDFNGIKFLTTLNSPLSEWQQIRLLRAISYLPAESIPFICSLLQHNNTTVIAFVLSLIRKFRVFMLSDEVAKLLSHKDSAIRVLALQTLQDLEAEHSISVLVNAYEEQEHEVKKAILLALRNSKNREISDFLKSKLLSGEADIKLIAADALASNGELDYLHALLEDEKNSEEIQLVIKHALSTRL